MSKFDVFLSFKNSDDDGLPTKEQLMADELYDALEKAGISVFYSKESLSDLGAAQYKAAIDDALDEVKALIAIGTSRDNLTSSWVRYEWDGFYGDILSGKKEGQLFSYIDDMEPSELPRTLRQLQCFERDKCSLDSICLYIANAIGVKTSIPHSVSAAQKTTKGSSYSFLQDREAERLSSQARLVCDNDVELLTPIINELSKDRKINVLDIGCADGYLTRLVFGKFEDKINCLVGVDHEQHCIDIANSNSNEPYHFSRIELETEDFEEKLSLIIREYNIEEFDLIFCSLVLHHLENPQKLLRKLRKHLRNNGQIYIRTCDDEEIVAYPDENDLVKKTLIKTAEIPGISDRKHGRKLFSEVYKSGYSDIMVKSYYVSTAEMNADERGQFFFDIFYWRKNKYKFLLEKEPENQKILQQYNECCTSYDEIEELFYDPAFYFRVSGPIVIAKK